MPSTNTLQIGKTSAVVLTLCGVLKDIMLVVASMMIWGTPVTPLQFFGYSIALGGMVYYKLGMEQIKGYAGEASRQWAEFGARKPILRKLSVIIMVFFTTVIMFTSFAPSSGYSPAKAVAEATNEMGKTGAN